MCSFKFSDYDCIGFDLDHTLLWYNVTNMVELEYNAMAKYMVEEKHYCAKFLYQPLSKDLNFLLKGLIIDMEKGNILRINNCGEIIKATHGTKLMTSNEIKLVYPNKRWDASDAFVNNPLDTWNGEWSSRIRGLLDYFDMPLSLIFARIIDSLDAKNDGKFDKYDCWKDCIDAAISIYDRTNFKKESGNYFVHLKKEPEKYIRKCSQEIIDWLCNMKKQNKIVYLITGSNVDFASFTASYIFGNNWRSLFDIVVCFAKKPGFFNGDRPFLTIDGFDECQEITGKQLEQGGIYSQGNWNDLKTFFSKVCHKSSPKCVYFGDNILQDIFAPNMTADWDTVVVSEEMYAEGMISDSTTHPDKETMTSNYWGSYFSIVDDDGVIYPSFSTHIIENNSKICIPSIKVCAENPLDHVYSCFDKKTNNKSGYHPALPLGLTKI